MKKRILCLIIMVLTLLPLATSCVKFKDDVEAPSNKKYDYELSDYIKLPDDYLNHEIDLELDAMQAAIDTYLLQAVKENSDNYKYKVSRGDSIYVDISVYEELILTSENNGEVIKKRGDKIESLSKSNYLIENLGKSSLPYVLQKDIIDSELNIKDILERRYSYDQLDGYAPAEYKGKNLYFTVKIMNKRVEPGDVVTVTYKGYHIDSLGNKLKDETTGKELAPFDSSTGAYFFPGTKLAIDDFENNLVGLLLNEQYSFNATFPEDYGEKDFQGKTVLFEVTITGVYTAPVYNNSFVKLWFSDYNSTTEFEASLQKEFIMSQMYTYVLDNAVISKYPEAEYNAHATQIEEASASFEQAYGYSFDEYIKKAYGMTRDEYIKSQMKTEMIYYLLSKEHNLVPTEEMLTNERESLISYYKTLYMTQNGLNEQTALDTATEFVKNLGETYVYENVMYTLVEEFLYTKATVNKVEKTYTSITETIAKNEAVTQ